MIVPTDAWSNLLTDMLLIILPVFLLTGTGLFVASQYIRFNYITALLVALPLSIPAGNLIPRDMPWWILPAVTILTLLGVIHIYHQHGMGSGRNLTRRPILPPGHRGVLLTFDDGPSPRWTKPVLECLENAGVRGVFFLVGRSVEENPGIVAVLSSAGMETAIHTHNHRPLILLFPGQIRREIALAIKSLTDAGCPAPGYFRPPWGLYNREIIDTALDMGLKTILWSQSTRDWASSSSEMIIRRGTENLSGGEILLLHDGHRHGISREATATALGEIISQLRSKGYEILDPGVLGICGGYGEGSGEKT